MQEKNRTLYHIYILSIAQRGKESTEKKRTSYLSIPKTNNNNNDNSSNYDNYDEKKKKTEESHNSVKRPRLGISDKTVNTRRPV